MTAPINHKIVLLGQSPGATAAFAGFVSTGTGVFTSAATNGLQIYNTADRTTNYERLALFWNSNIATISSTASGTGSVRRMVLSTSFGQQLFFNVANSSNGQYQFSGASTATAGSTLAAFIATNTATSGTNEYLAIRPTYNQASGTAANTDLLINRTETAVGSGAQYLIQAQVGSSDRLWLSNSGNLYVINRISIGNAVPSAKLSVGTGISSGAWGTAGIQQRNEAGTFTDSTTAASGTAASAVFSSFAQPTLAATNSSVTTTDAATLYIAAAPAAGTNQTITNAYALWIDSGRIRYDETASVSAATASTHKVPINIGGTIYYILLTNV